MTFFSAWCRWLILMLLAALPAGCYLDGAGERDEKKETHYLAGMSRMQSMDYKGAKEAFERALEVNPRSSAAHFDLGLLYASKLNDIAASQAERDRNYAAAIYHLEKYLDLNPDSRLKDHVRQHIMACKIELTKTVPSTLLSSAVQSELERLYTTNTALRQKVEQLNLMLVQQAFSFSNHLASLQAQYAAAQNPPESTARQPSGRPDPPIGTTDAIRQAAPPRRTEPPPPREVAPREEPRPAARQHRVQPGETLSSIGRRYGVSLTAMREANRNVDPRRMRPGDIVQVPAR